MGHMGVMLAPNFTCAALKTCSPTLALLNATKHLLRTYSKHRDWHLTIMAAVGAVYCDDACPDDKPVQRLVMSCEGMQTDCDGVECRWKDGTTVPAELDSEASTFSCSVPAVCDHQHLCETCHALTSFMA